MESKKDFLLDVGLILGCFGLSFLAVVSAPTLYSFSKNAANSFVNFVSDILWLNFTDTDDDEYKQEINNFVDIDFIPNLIDLDVTSTSSVINFINIYFIKELILISKENISSCYHQLVSNECFYYLIKKIFSVEENKINFLNDITDPFRKAQVSFFLEDLINSKNVDSFRSLKKNIYSIEVILKFIIKKYNLK